MKVITRRKILTISTVLIVIFLLATTLYSYYFNNSVSVPTNINEKQTIPWAINKMNVRELWNEGLTGKGIKVAIMDSGVDASHPDLIDNMNSGINIIDPTTPPTDYTGHGTFIAGIIGASNNHFGLVGVAPDVELYPVKVLDELGEGDILHIEKGIDWCIENGIQIINMSFAINNNKPQLHEAINRALSKGIIIISSASNSYGETAGYPASYNQVFSVNAVDRNLDISELASLGKIDFSAPGVDILSTHLHGGYGVISGNSYAAPQITGFIALLLQDPAKFGVTDLTHDQIKNVLSNYSTDLGIKGYDSLFGAGFVNFN
ncbi:S8 family peptidase [Paenibacillus agilis]|uniref:S8 family serine peptidase n=1 Tax=Paenibacillus agilis TaxID=3020863 RepID=A0A559J2H4_9BACL|nr:S8 family serine peptidase [Paenibacillus agilis]TVX94061.1 S8 family serine peptidase [Paenibacillus agilis]